MGGSSFVRVHTGLVNEYSLVNPQSISTQQVSIIVRQQHVHVDHSTPYLSARLQQVLSLAIKITAYY